MTEVDVVDAIKATVLERGRQALLKPSRPVKGVGSQAKADIVVKRVISRSKQD